MSHVRTATTRELQHALIRTADRDTLILTASGRLARRLRHLYTATQIGKGRHGWFSPQIMTLNSWMADLWANSWPDEIPASYFKSLYLWERAVAQVGCPEGIEADLRLYQAFDETYSGLIRHKLQGLPLPAHSALFSWRNEVIRAFEDSLRSRHMVCTAALPDLIVRGIMEGRFRLPGRILMAGFDSPSPAEKELMDVLTARNGAVIFRTELQSWPKVRAVSLETLQKETEWLLEDLFQKSRVFPLHRIGVVVPEMQKYSAQFSGLLDILAGRPADASSGSYNISYGGSLLKEPLIQAGLLPLKFMPEGEKRRSLLALILSPYYREWDQNRVQLAQADRIWRRYSVDSGLDSLLKTLKISRPELFSMLNQEDSNLRETLALLSQKRLAAAGWARALKAVWSRFRFPAVSDEHEKVIYGKLEETLTELASSLGPEKMDSGTFHAWIKHALDCSRVNVHSYEQAGIQVLGLLEARCLSFDHLYVAGLSSSSIPQPVRHFPLLSREEKVFVQGATVESQYSFGRRIYEHLMTSSPGITLTRSLTEGDSPLSPSPFWPGHEEKADINVWLEPGPLFMRAEWLKQGHTGWRGGSQPYPPAENNLAPSPLPRALSVSELDTAFSCPFRFLLQAVFKVLPLEEPAPGISPPDKGNKLHQVLALITRRVRKEGISLDSKQDMERTVQECMQDVLRTRTEDPNWQVEKKRWLDEGTSTHLGLLRKWLAAEQARKMEGWEWLEEEVSFDKLEHPSWAFSLNGRIDRIDYQKQNSRICCWDYKTGNIPGTREITDQFLASQLPCYLLAIKAGRIKLPLSNPNLTAGYIKLKLEGDVQMIEPLQEDNLWSDCLSLWEEEIAGLGKRLAAGQFPPDPRPAGSRSPCRLCSYAVLCKFQLLSVSGSEEDGD